MINLILRTRFATIHLVFFDLRDNLTVSHDPFEQLCYGQRRQSHWSAGGNSATNTEARQSGRLLTGPARTTHKHQHTPNSTTGHHPTSKNRRTTMNTDAREESGEYRETEEERRMRDERFVEKFFTERELIVKYDDTSESHEKNAHAWYEAVGRTMNTLPTYQHDNVGQPLPKTNTSKADSTSFSKAATPDSNDDTFDSKTAIPRLVFSRTKRFQLRLHFDPLSTTISHNPI